MEEHGYGYWLAKQKQVEKIMGLSGNPMKRQKKPSKTILDNIKFENDSKIDHKMWPIIQELAY